MSACLGEELIRIQKHDECNGKPLRPFVFKKRMLWRSITASSLLFLITIEVVTVADFHRLVENSKQDSKRLLYKFKIISSCVFMCVWMFVWLCVRVFVGVCLRVSVCGCMVCVFVC